LELPGGWRSPAELEATEVHLAKVIEKRASNDSKEISVIIIMDKMKGIFYLKKGSY